MKIFNINYLNEQNKHEINEEVFISNAQKMLDYLFKQTEIIEDSILKEYDLTQKTVNIDVLLCDDEKIKEINSVYRGKDKSTDVISFAIFADIPEDSPVAKSIINNEINLGEIMISTETTYAQAMENGKTFEQELYWLLAHGMMHLLGFGHPTPEWLKFMIDTQNEMVGVLEL